MDKAAVDRDGPVGGERLGPGPGIQGGLSLHQEEAPLSADFGSHSDCRSLSIPAWLQESTTVADSSD